MISKRNGRQAALHAVMLLLVAINLFPLVWMVSTSIKSASEIFSDSIYFWPKQFSLESYRIVFTEYAFFSWLKNSIFSTLGIFVLQLVVSLCAAFALGYYRTKWNKTAFNFLLITMVIPFQVTMIPNYITISRMGMINSWWGVVLPYAANASTFFYLYQNVRGIPKAYYEVARIEGAHSFWTFRRVTIGLCRGAISAISILTIIESWNLYFWPLLVLTKAETRTLTIALKQFLDFEMGNRWGPFMATATLASLPVIIAYLFFQRGIINAFISAGVKG